MQCIWTRHDKQKQINIFLKASGPGGLKSSDIAEVGLGGGTSASPFVLEPSLESSLTPKLCFGNTGLGRKSSLLITFKVFGFNQIKIWVL